METGPIGKRRTMLWKPSVRFDKSIGAHSPAGSIVRGIVLQLELASNYTCPKLLIVYAIPKQPSLCFLAQQMPLESAWHCSGCTK